MGKQVSEKEILNEVILGYRSVISERYQYYSIRSKYNIPDSFDEDRVERYRNYFLNHIYPLPEVRDELNEAFNSLDNFIAQPDKLLRILMDSAGVILKYGLRLPKILKTSVKAFQSFRAATRFEGQLVNAALELGLQPPFNAEDIYALLKTLSHKEIDRFIEMNRSMLETLYDRRLMRDITEMVEQIIGNMKKHKAAYSEQEIKGLEIGLQMIKEGNQLFDQLSRTDQQQIFNLIISMEQQVLEELFNAEQ